MRFKTVLAAAPALLLWVAGVVPVQAGEPETYGLALDLYGEGFYERARTLFETMPEGPLSEGYSVLCALKMRTRDAGNLFDRYNQKYPASSLSDPIHYERGRMLFDDGLYDRASLEFSVVNLRSVPKDDRAEFMFKSGYCHFEEKRYENAVQCFEYVDRTAPFSDFAAPSAYLSGVIQYNARNFKVAEDWFGKSVRDPRFSDISRFYIVDCEFNLKNYDFVIEEGGKLYGTVPLERREHLARMLSESYLVRGDKLKAREFYLTPSDGQMTRSDYFHAGSVLYAVEDYGGAIENFLKMTDRSDSLGQIANYQMGNSYIRLRNKVAAIGAFKAASDVDYDARMTEDALFNYAKLTFDLNKDTDGFADYIKRYSTKSKGEQIYSYMALAALYDKDYSRAIDAYDQIDELDPEMRRNYAKANYLRAEQLVSRGSYRDAIPYLRACSYYLDRNDRFNQLSRYWLGETNYRSGNYEEAGKVFTELYNASALSGRQEGELLPYNVAYGFFSGGDWDNAAKWFDIYEKSGSRLVLADALTRRADCDFAKKDYKAAIESYGRAISFISDMNDIYPYYRQAIAYGLAGRKKEKISVLSGLGDAGPATPFYSEALYELGRTQMELKKNDAAIATFDRLRGTSLDNSYVARALIGMGMAYRNVSNYDKALSCYKEAVALMPGSEYAEDALPAIESIYQKTGHPERFLTYLEENSLLTGNSAGTRDRIYFNTAEQLFLGQNYTQAIASLQEYLGNFPEGGSRDKALFYLAESYKSLNNKEKACEIYASVIETAPGSSFAEMARLNYSKLSYELERYTDSFTGYETLLKTARIEANRLTARVGMMRSAFKCRDFDSAISSAEAVRSAAASDGELRRESVYVMAKSCLATSRRDRAMELFGELAREPSTGEGAEARYILVQDAYDRGEFEKVESLVYDFSDKAGNEMYWLAKCYVLLGDSFVELGKRDQAKSTYKSILDGYSAESGNSEEIAESVRARLDRLSNIN